MKAEFEVVFNYINKDKLIEQIKNLGGVCIKKYSYLKVRDEGKGKINFLNLISSLGKRIMIM